MENNLVLVKGLGVKLPRPNDCPHCHVKNFPQYVWASDSEDTDNNIVTLSAWLCANVSCKKIFIASHYYRNGYLEFHRYLNGNPIGPNWPKPILELKDGNTFGTSDEKPSRFIKTYLQSLTAESNGLDEIAGMGYRKAIEYLVKDWAIQCDPGAKDKIESSWLGALINQYFEGELKGILERATWLGNDQAHYKRLFEEYNLEVIKDLISLIMVELERQFKISHYNTVIEKRK